MESDPNVGREEYWIDEVSEFDSKQFEAWSKPLILNERRIIKREYTIRLHNFDWCDGNIDKIDK